MWSRGLVLSLINRKGQRSKAEGELHKLWRSRTCWDKDGILKAALTFQTYPPDGCFSFSLTISTCSTATNPQPKAPHTKKRRYEAENSHKTISHTNTEGCFSIRIRGSGKIYADRCHHREQTRRSINFLRLVLSKIWLFITNHHTMQVSHTLNHKLALELATSQVFNAQSHYHFMVTWHVTFIKRIAGRISKNNLQRWILQQTMQLCNLV